MQCSTLLAEILEPAKDQLGGGLLTCWRGRWQENGTLAEEEFDIMACSARCRHD